VGARIAGLKATESICPYCAVGCAQVVYTRDGQLVDIEGHPRSPINQGALCPKGSASRQLASYVVLALSRPCTCRESILPGLVWPEHRAEPLLTRALITTVREVDLVGVVDRCAASGR
jgi:hypothetical protein